MDYFSPAAITDQTGAATERYSFTAFGIRSILTPAFSPIATSECEWTFAFQGQFQDSESQFLNYGYRYYSPFCGMWLCKDPIAEQKGGNLYQFSENDGVNQIDYLGLMTKTEVDTRIAQLDAMYQQIPCCCKIKNASMTVTIDGTAIYSTVTTTAHTSPEIPACKFVVDYFWWNCFRGQHQAGIFVWGGNECWQQYGWSEAGPDGSQDWNWHASGGILFDGLHWNFQAIIAFAFCDPSTQHFRVLSALSNQYQFTWDEPSHSWTGGSPPP
jgi:RHS repeat-associated protein